MTGCAGFKTYKKDVENFQSDGNAANNIENNSDQLTYPVADEIIRPEHLENLPDIVQRYLTNTGILGTKMVSTVQLRQSGKIRTKPGAQWMNLKAVETYNIELSGFIWYAEVKMNSFVWMTGYDNFQNGRGKMKIKLYDLFPVVNASGESIDQGGMIRYLNELMWFPMGFLHPSVTWGKETKNSIEVMLTIRDRTVSGTFEFSREGIPINFTAKRYMDDGKGNASLETWITPMDSWRVYSGLTLPEHGYAAWVLDSGEFRYIELKVEDVEFGTDSIWEP